MEENIEQDEASVVPNFQRVADTPPKRKDTFAETLGTEPMPLVVNKTTNDASIVVSENQDDISNEAKEDFTYIRKTIKEAINTGVDSLKDLQSLAQTSEHPRTFEVLSGLIKNITESGTALLTLHKTKKDLAKSKEKDDAKPTISANNAIFVGTPADLLKQINPPELPSDKVIDVEEIKDEETM